MIGDLMFLLGIFVLQLATVGAAALVGAYVLWAGAMLFLGTVVAVAGRCRARRRRDGR